MRRRSTWVKRWRLSKSSRIGDDDAARTTWSRSRLTMAAAVTCCTCHPRSTRSSASSSTTARSTPIRCSIPCQTCRRDRAIGPSSDWLTLLTSRPDHDILLPARLTAEEVPYAFPEAGTCNPPPAALTDSDQRVHSALFAFDPDRLTGQIAYHGVRIRQALRELWAASPPLKDALWVNLGIGETVTEMARSIL